MQRRCFLVSSLHLPTMSMTTQSTVYPWVRACHSPTLAPLCRLYRLPTRTTLIAVSPWTQCRLTLGLGHVVFRRWLDCLHTRQCVHLQQSALGASLPLFDVEAWANLSPERETTEAETSLPMSTLPM